MLFLIMRECIKETFVSDLVSYKLKKIRKFVRCKYSVNAVLCA